MRRPTTLSVFSALITASLAAPQSSECAYSDIACLSQGIFTSSTTQPTHVDRTAQPANQDGCVCVPYYQCNKNDTIGTKGAGLIEIRFGGPSESIVPQPVGHGACEHYLDRCCMPPDILAPRETITPKPPIRRSCGRRNPGGVGLRITGHKENEAQFGEFPWMVAILREEMIPPNTEKKEFYQCGGALIHYRAVLTAAHCVKEIAASQLKVRAGEWDTQTEKEILPHQDRYVKAVIVHEKFNPDTLENDVAILILRSPVKLAGNVDLVCLPADNENFDAARCFASGWGKDVFGKNGRYQVILKRIELPVVSHDVCQTYLRNTRLGKYFVLDRSFTCAGGEAGKDTCKGDGGSPLVCPTKADPSRYVQVGAVAWGVGCGENGVPGVYVNIPFFRPWIDEQLVQNNLDITVLQR